MSPPILSFLDIDIALNPGEKVVPMSFYLIQVSVKAHRVKLFSMRLHWRSAVLFTTDRQFTSTHSIIDSFVSSLTKLFSRSIVMIEVRSNCLAGLASMHLFSTSVTIVFTFLCILSSPLDLQYFFSSQSLLIPRVIIPLLVMLSNY